MEIQRSTPDQASQEKPTRYPKDWHSFICHYVSRRCALVQAARRVEARKRADKEQSE